MNISSLQELNTTISKIEHILTQSSLHGFHIFTPDFYDRELHCHKFNATEKVKEVFAI